MGDVPFLRELTKVTSSIVTIEFQKAVKKNRHSCTGLKASLVPVQTHESPSSHLLMNSRSEAVTSQTTRIAVAKAAAHNTFLQFPCTTHLFQRVLKELPNNTAPTFFHESTLDFGLIPECRTQLKGVHLCSMRRLNLESNLQCKGPATALV